MPQSSERVRITLPPPRVGVVIPCYRVTRHIGDVLEAIGRGVHRIYCVDDGCPEASGAYIRAHSLDPRVVVLEHGVHRGIGVATVTGYRRALADGCDVVVKIDGDGQMDPRLIPAFVRPILRGDADYTKGNRFASLEAFEGMPPGRLLGNAMLTLLTKASSGYWNLVDPTNGYTAIHAAVLRELPLADLAGGDFFAYDMLFRLRQLRAAVHDVPVEAHDVAGRGQVRTGRNALSLLGGHLRNAGRRVLFDYFLRDFNAASLALVAGTLLLAAGAIFGGVQWSRAAATGVPASPGAVMLSALPVLVGLQLLLSAVQYDIGSVPRRVVHPLLEERHAAIEAAVRPGAAAPAHSPSNFRPVE